MSLAFNKTKTIISKPKFTTGFTLIELLVTLTIFSILTGVVLFNHQKFNSTILLTNLAYDTALTIRQAQTYGINIREFNTGTGGGVFVPYGVHFNMASDKSFILFADLTYDSASKNSDGSYEGNIASCVNNTEYGCISRYNITRGNRIKFICAESVEDTNECSSGKTLDNVSISYKRPNPNAIINTLLPDSTVLKYDVVTIILAGVDDGYRKVRVWENGLIEID